MTAPGLGRKLKPINMWGMIAFALLLSLHGSTLAGAPTSSAAPAAVAEPAPDGAELAREMLQELASGTLTEERARARYLALPIAERDRAGEFWTAHAPRTRMAGSVLAMMRRTRLYSVDAAAPELVLTPEQQRMRYVQRGTIKTAFGAALMTSGTLGAIGSVTVIALAGDNASITAPGIMGGISAALIAGGIGLLVSGDSSFEAAGAP